MTMNTKILSLAFVLITHPGYLIFSSNSIHLNKFGGTRLLCENVVK